MKNLYFQATSYISSPYCFSIALVLSCVGAYYGFAIVSGYLFFLCLLSLSAFVWGRCSELGIHVDIQAQTRQVYPGQDITMDFTLRNDKFLPLLWLEWVQPYPPNHCLSVPSAFHVCDITNPGATTIIDPVVTKRFSFIGWYATMQWSATFHAQRRGVYMPQTVDIQTGDGFGFSVRRSQHTLPAPPVFVIYPQRVGVTTDLFFKNAWSATTGPHGVIEDVTVLRNTRVYQPKDSFKRINWRLAARTGDLNVNLYDTIAPRTVYFFVDTASFHGISEDNQAFEESLSVLGSVIDQLFSLGMSVGLYLPGDNTIMDTEQSTCSDCLLALALANCDDPVAQFSPQTIAQLLSAQSGHIYYLCHDASTGGFATLFEETTISVISYKEPDPTSGVDVWDMPIHLVSDFKRG